LTKSKKGLNCEALNACTLYLTKTNGKKKIKHIQNTDYKRLENCVDISFNYLNPVTVCQMADCPFCKGARGLNKKEEFIEHLDSHQEMAMNHDMMFRKFKEYVLAHESFTE
jgi:hypothetical protein